ncbi:zinc ribbon domain-containing protein [Ramlibacter sp. AW1]|uniref:Zinc ribbon domain-containing protein n=1 Tax=Ramlibacter aurantiacus TaxID=2801330 RepID=A0A937D6I3_9BURK|nr:FmdB family zinc ribbon protein [Ramlibacter aurantiacus]MBL0420983.1 zinc ribbon domain-containing protein [Ramlibacter aurantiacus]
MPIYAYKCGSCGHAKDVLQKISDAPLSVCPACGADAFSKQITAAGFQLKGSGWYVTDFRNGSGAGSAPASTSTSGSTDAKGTDGGSKPAESTPTPAAKSDGPTASAGGCGSACACH